MSDHYTGIFDNVSPADFVVSTTAIHSVPNGFAADQFDAFADSRLDQARTTFLATEGQMNPIAQLATGSNIRSYVPEDDENIGDFIARLNREARSMQAEWVFIAMATKVGSHKVDPDEANDPADVEAVRDQLEDGLVWYAERRNQAGERAHRHGVMWLAEGKLVERSNTEQAFPILSLILDL